MEDAEKKQVIELVTNDLKQCELIWKPIYQEYRKLGYRLNERPNQLTIYDLERN